MGGTAQSAISYAQAQAQRPSQNWLNRCLQFVNNAWGNSVPWLGSPTAAQSWLAAPNKHTDNSTPPPGAAVYWAVPGNPDGHVALSMGGGNVATTDFCATGKVCVVPLDRITQGWGADYLGWADPNNAQGSPSDATANLTATSGTNNLTADAIKAVVKSGHFLPPNFGIRFLWFALGLFCVVAAYIILFRRPISKAVTDAVKSA